MDEFDNNDSNSSGAGDTEEVQPEQELSHSDKMVGIFTEPGATFEKMAKFPPRTIDWFLPMIILLVLVFISNFLLLNNKEIYYQTKEKQMAKMEKTFNDMVKEGKMTKEQAQEQMNRIQDRMDKGITTLQIVLQGVGILIFGFIIFFIMAGIYFLFAKFAFKGEGSYQSALVASGMTAYIGMVQIVIATIVAFLMGRMMNDISLATLLDANKSTFGGFVLGKLDVFALWSYSVVSIGLAKMFKSSSALKYFLMVFGIWILGGLLFFLLAQAVPFLRFFGM